MVEEGTRYLFGDSESFSLQFNVLETLSTLVPCCAELASLYDEVEQLRERVDEFVRNRDELIEELARFSEAAGNDLETLAGTSRRPELVEHGAEARRVVDEALARAKGRYQQECEQERRRAAAEVDARQVRMRKELVTFLQEGVFRIDTPSFDVRVDGERVKASLRCEVPMGISAAFDIEVDKVGWAAPRKVESLSRGLELEVGLRKRLLRRKPVAERVVLDEYYIVGLRARTDALELELAKRLDEPGDRFALKLKRREGEIGGVVVKRDAESEPRPIQPQDLPAIEGLWQAVHRELHAMWTQARVLRSMRADGEDPSEPDAVMRFLERIVAEYRPIVRELAAHSANDHELSLKIDRGSGRREELYISRDDLSGPLLTLPEHLIRRVAFFELLPPGTLSESPALLLLDSDDDDEPSPSLDREAEAPPKLSAEDVIDEESEAIAIPLLTERDNTTRYRTYTLDDGKEAGANRTVIGAVSRPQGVVSGVVKVG